MEVKLGYKQTEVGAIPADWQVSTLGETCVFENGDRGINYPSPASFARTGVPFVNAGHVGEGHINRNDMDYITRQAYDRLGAGKIDTGDILFCLRGSLGKFGVVDPDFGEGAIASSLVIVRPRSSSLRVDYLSYYFSSSPCARMIGKWSGGAAQPNLGAQDLARFVFPAPPLLEQRAIATALSDVDALLGGLDRLIAKKRDLKQAAMQQLLTGQTRLPRFEGEWEVKRIDEIADTDPENLSVTTNPSYQFNYISLEDVDYGYLVGCSEQVFVQAPSRARRRVQADDVLVATVRPNLKSHLRFSVQGGEWVCSTGFCVIRCRKEVSDPGYVFQHFFADLVNNQIESLIAGSNYPAINNADIRALSIPIPAIDEQTAIATVLSDMDVEMEALLKRRHKTRDLKQAMMQELLTGRTRLL